MEYQYMYTSWMWCPVSPSIQEANTYKFMMAVRNFKNFLKCSLKDERLDFTTLTDWLFFKALHNWFSVSGPLTSWNWCTCAPNTTQNKIFNTVHFYHRSTLKVCVENFQLCIFHLSYWQPETIWTWNRELITHGRTPPDFYGPPTRCRKSPTHPTCNRYWMQSGKASHL
jgi:hypothetical protein